MMVRKFISIVAATASVAVFVSCSSGDSEPVIDKENEVHRASYMLGRDIGRTLKGFDTELDLAVLTQAIREVLGDKEAQFSDSALVVIDGEFRNALNERREQKRIEEMRPIIEKNKADAEAFFAKNKTEPGVVTTESGLQYVMTEEGKGKSPTLEDKVKVHYHGTLLDGTVFDSSRDRGTPAEFPITGVIKGWTEALQLMKVGGKIKIFVPSDLAYGERGAPRSPIGPHMALVFEIELLDIIKEKK